MHSQKRGGENKNPVSSGNFKSCHVAGVQIQEGNSKG